ARTSDFHPLALPSFPTRRSSDLRGSVRHFPAVQAIVSNRNIYKITADGASEFPGLPYTPQGGHAHGTRTRKGKADQGCTPTKVRSEEHTSELQSRFDLVCRLLLE